MSAWQHNCAPSPHHPASPSGAGRPGGRAMKTIILALLFSTGVVCANSTNFMVPIGGRLRSASEIEQLVLAHASRTHMQFDFAGVVPHFILASNGPAVISMWCAQTNGTYFHAAVNRKGTVYAQELTSRDAQDIRAVLARETTNRITQVWLGPEGRVGAITVRSGKEEGEVFWFKRGRGKWAIDNRGIWNVVPPLSIPAREIHAR